MPDHPNHIIIDLDGTLCPIKRPDQSYSEVAPHATMVRAIRRWKDQGFKITIHTARNMRTYGGNLAVINKHTARMTMDWLDRHHIPYDEILFGKPWPGPEGFYVDDRSIRPREFLHYSLDQLSDIFSRDRLGQTSNLSAPEVVITMAGDGTRFAHAGYDVPKFQIKAKGLPLFFWSLLSLTEFIKAGSRFIFIAQKAANARNFILDHCKILGIRDIQIIEIESPTDGQATTALLGREYWYQDAPLAIYNIDTYVEPGLMSPTEARGEGWIPCFDAPGDHWSFVSLGPDDLAVEVTEKLRISDHCTVGLYWFSSCRLYEDAYQAYYEEHCPSRAKERYVAPIYNQIIHSGGKVNISTIESECVHILGTPDELEAFIR